MHHWLWIVAFQFKSLKTFQNHQATNTLLRSNKNSKDLISSNMTKITCGIFSHFKKDDVSQNIVETTEKFQIQIKTIFISGYHCWSAKSFFGQNIILWARVLKVYDRRLWNFTWKPQMRIGSDWLTHKWSQKTWGGAQRSYWWPLSVADRSLREGWLLSPCVMNVKW